MGYINSVLSNPAFQVFLIAMIGYIIGRIKIKGIEVGDAGILIVSLIAGHFGVTCPSFAKSIGIVLFVASVGLIAGPKFFHNFMHNFKSYVILGFCIIIAGGLCTAVICLIGNVNGALAAGLLSGALTSTPGFAAAQEAAGSAKDIVSVGYGIAYPFGVIGVVLFVQLMPKILKVDMAKERAKLAEDAGNAPKSFKTKGLISVDSLGMMPLCLTIVLGLIIGLIKIPLPGGAFFSLGTSGGPLIAGLLVGHIVHIGPIDLKPKKSVMECMREFGLILFLIGAGCEGGAGFVDTLVEQGPILFVYGMIMTLVPMIVGYLFAKKVLKLPILNNMGALCGGMTSTPALGSLIQVAGTDDVASAYASTYPIALVTVVLVEQMIVLLF